MTARFTDTQGQYLAFIHTYWKLHRRAPAETDFQTYFRVTPPTAHRMIVTLTDRGLIHRRPGEARTIELLVAPEDVPPLR
jgi:DNA-binding MarR family transcriptional regulator